MGFSCILSNLNPVWKVCLLNMKPFPVPYQIYLGLAFKNCPEKTLLTFTEQNKNINKRIAIIFQKSVTGHCDVCSPPWQSTEIFHPFQVKTYIVSITFFVDCPLQSSTFSAGLVKQKKVKMET